MYALNVADLTRYSAIMRSALVGPHITDPPQLISPAKDRLDEGAVVLANTSDVQAEAIIDVLRGQDARLKQYKLRAWKQGPRGGWTRVR